jgi:aminoglycoside 6'-N-acetyltransferase
MMLYKNDEITVRTLTENDAPLLVKWLSDPQVIEYYAGRDRPYNLEMVKNHFYERTIEITQCIVIYSKHEIGYIQFYIINDQEIEEYGFKDFKGNIYGMDQFIGEVDFWNKGIGTKLVSSMVKYLVEHQSADKIVLDPQTWNVRAVRVYEKCGFKKIKLLPQHERHEGQLKDCWLMEYAGDGKSAQ